MARKSRYEAYAKGMNGEKKKSKQSVLDKLKSKKTKTEK